LKIAVLFGGTSEERDVSIASAAQIIPGLLHLGHEVFAVDTATGRLAPPEERKLLAAGVAPEPPSDTAIANVRGRAITLSPAAFDIRDADVVFLALHGGAGEDGRIQAMLDLAGMTYTGSNHIASAAAMDKDLSKRLFRSVDVPTPDWLMAPTAIDAVERTLGWPVVVKSNKQGSTVGLSVVREPAQLPAAIKRATEAACHGRLLSGVRFLAEPLGAPVASFIVLTPAAVTSTIKHHTAIFTALRLFFEHFLNSSLYPNQRR
jgi:D-alanine-D-alanine ligase